MDDKIKELEKKIQELEKKLNQTSNMFGRAYSQIGNSNSDFLIKTKGQLKVQWGNKFIDLIKDGKVNTESKFIYSVNSESDIKNKEGIYITKEGQVFIKVSKQDPINVVAGDGNFLSLDEGQETTQEQKYNALVNIGLICSTINDVPEIKSGFIYVENENKLYIVNNGNLSEINSSFQNPLTVQLIINQTEGKEGSLIINGSGKQNGIRVGKQWIYDKDNLTVSGINQIKFLLNDIEISSITPQGLIVNQIKSKDYSQNSGFTLDTINGKSTLIIDEVIERTSSNDSDSSSDYIIYGKKTKIIDSARVHIEIVEDTEEEETEEENNEENEETEEEKRTWYLIVDSSIFNINDRVYILVNSENLFGTIINIENFGEEQLQLQVLFDENLEEIEQLKNFNELDLYLYSQSIIIEENTFYIPDNLYIGNLSKKSEDLQEIGMYAKNALFENASYISELPLDDNSKKFASTEWVNKQYPSGSVILFDSNLEIPSGWEEFSSGPDYSQYSLKFIKKL